MWRYMDPQHYQCIFNNGSFFCCTPWLKPAIYRASEGKKKVHVLSSRFLGASMWVLGGAGIKNLREMKVMNSTRDNHQIISIYPWDEVSGAL